MGIRLQCTNHSREYNGIIVASYVINNPTDHYELIPLIKEVKSNLSQIFDEISSNFQVSAVMDIQLT